MPTNRRQTSIKVNIDDARDLMTVCKELYLRDNPEMRGVHLTRKFMFHKVIEFYKRM